MGDDRYRFTVSVRAAGGVRQGSGWGGLEAGDRGAGAEGQLTGRWTLEED